MARVRRISFALMTLAVLCVIPTACASCQARNQGHSTPEPAAVILVRDGSTYTEIGKGTLAFEAARTLLDELVKYDTTRPGVWPEDPAALAQPAPVESYVMSARGATSAGGGGAGRIILVFDTESWLRFPEDGSASLPEATDAAASQGVPFRAAPGGGTEYHVRVVVIDWSVKPFTCWAVLRTESSREMSVGWLTGAWLRTVDPGISSAIDHVVAEVE